MGGELSTLYRLTKYVKLTETELLHLAQMVRPFRRFDAKTTILEEGARAPQCFLLLEGWVGSFSTSRHGRRTMVRIYMPGDLVGHTSLAYEDFAETLVTLSPCVLAAISSRAIGSLFETHARLASILYVVAQEERVRQMDWISSLLRLKAAGRMATLFLDLRDRHAAISAHDDPAIPFHLSQYEIADLTGLTTTHTNRIVQQFRRDGAIDLRHHVLTIIAPEMLERLADRPQRRVARDMSWLPAPSH